ncbi:DUF7935 family protein [Flectobacillus major]|jgi:hypothetical protein|uniref:DUF7935 family protein n=1 Tax=Flectobacillus major TaxID=103 RepID=UPI00040C12AD|nr:hypothetical protein [Flectobacillus major]
MEIVADLVKVLIPASLVLGAMYLTISSFIKKDFDQKALDTKLQLDKTVIPIRLEAYERICLLLERVNPSHLLVRLSDTSLNVVSFQQLLISEIRAEFAHNFSQQVYMSDEAWLTVKNAINETISLINLAARELDGQASSIELSKKVFEILIQSQINATETALLLIKNEARNQFM